MAAEATAGTVTVVRETGRDAASEDECVGTRERQVGSGQRGKRGMVKKKNYNCRILGGEKKEKED